MKDKCIIFSRVSTLHQDLVQQTEAVKAEALRLGYKPSQLIYIESKESAISRTLEEREGISELLEKLTEASCIIVWELSRLARRADVMYRLRDLFIENHIQLIVMTPYMQLLDEDGKMSTTASLMLALFTSLAESEMTVKKERMRRGLISRINQGYYGGGIPLFGYKPNKDKRYEVDEEAAEVIKKVFSMYATGEYSFRRIGIELRDSGLINSIRNTSALSKVHEILNEQRYAGYDPHFPMIVTPDLFEKCQDIMITHRTKTRPANKHEMLGKGILRTKEHDLCMACVSRNCAYNSTSADSVMTVIRQSHIDPLIWSTALKLHKKYISNKTIRQKQLLEELKSISTKIQHTKQDLKDAQSRIDKLEERIVMGSISNEKADELHLKLVKQYREVEAKLQQYTSEADKKGQQMYDDYWLEDNGAYDNLSYEEKRKIIMQVIDKIYISRSKENHHLILVEFHPKYGNIIYNQLLTKRSGYIQVS